MPFVADEFTGRRFGKYEVLCRIAVGGMAEIFLGFPLGGPFALRPVVLKRILSDGREDHSSLQMLIDEAKLTAQLAHAHVAQVLDLEVDGEDVILVIELIQGANLEELTEAATHRRELLPLPFVVSVVRDAALGLQHAHAHKDARGAAMPIIHRDVTPRNLMVTFKGVGKVLDFGIARAVGASRRTVAGMVRGTAAYMSPEQAIDAKVDTRSDIFSLGTIFHELLTGQRLFARGNPGKEMAAVYEAEIPPPSAVNKRVPKALDAIVLRALDRAAPRRYQSPAELIAELAAAAQVTAWPADRCGQLVSELFAQRQRDLQALLQRIPDDGVGAAITDVSRSRLSEEELASEARTVVGLPAAAPVTELPQPPAPAKPHASPQGARKSAKHADASVAPTKFFTPDFTRPGPPSSPSVEHVTDEGPVPQELAESQATWVTQPGLPTGATPTPSRPPPSPPTVPERVRPAVHGTETRRTPPRGAARTVLMVLGAVAAMVLGASGGVLVYRSMAPQRSAGVGRVSVATDRPAEVRMGDTVMKAPFADVYLAAGHQTLEVRELGTSGPWKKVEFEVSPDQVTRLQLTLDAAH
ncbi:MAG: protein kinase [Archangiaceae bacterium]|nr:protein kinase [Archangiaceae bacterium]